jgi:two-component system chemotaxis response regulator CheB
MYLSKRKEYISKNKPVGFPSLKTKMKYQLVVIGSSAGGLEALKKLIGGLKDDFALPMVIVQHMSPDAENYLPLFLNNIGKIKAKEADEKESPRKGTVYIAPPNYHLLLEIDRTFTLTVDERVNYARPAIDVLFETAAEAYGEQLIGIILTGANNDGTAGMNKIKEYGGMTIVQDPAEAEVNLMPLSAIQAVQIDHVLKLDVISEFLNNL